MSGLKFNGTPEEEHAAARYAALMRRAMRTSFQCEAENAQAAAVRLRSAATLGLLWAHVPEGAAVRLAEPDRFVVLVDDVPWWRAQLGLLCASFAGFEDSGAVWEWHEDEGDYATTLCGPPNAVLEAQVLYAATSFVLTTLVPRPYIWNEQPELITA